ncbi:MAG: endonuclease III [Deltaproteobacteria bacterium]|nr:endonuclease III [Deltaproteobacteria bacterium]
MKSAEERAPEILKLLAKAYPDAKCELDYETPLQLLVATILSAQCTDVRVNQLTPELFKKYPTMKAFAESELPELEEDIRPTGFYRNKAKNIQRACLQMLANYQGEVPETMEELTQLAGIGRKSANVLLGNCFETPGVIVDTHVLRIAKRLGFSMQDNPEKLELELQKLVPQPAWTKFSTLITIHGRRCCFSRKPACDRCPVAHLCPSANKIG